MVGPIGFDAFIARWGANEGGAERANYVLFLTELCTLLELPQPEPANATNARNDYVHERAVTFTTRSGVPGTGALICTSAAAPSSKQSRAANAEVLRRSHYLPNRVHCLALPHLRHEADDAPSEAGAF